VLHTTDPEHLAPLGYFMSRLAVVDPAAAAAILIEASQRIAAWPGTEQAWKRRRAHRWRAAIADVLAAQDWSDWKVLMADLAGAESSIFVQATQLSVGSRGVTAEKHLDALINDTPDHLGLLRAALTSAIARKHRVIGSQSAWPAILQFALPVVP
jgi:hypothetical protein